MEDGDGEVVVAEMPGALLEVAVASAAQNVPVDGSHTRVRQAANLRKPRRNQGEEKRAVRRRTGEEGEQENEKDKYLRLAVGEQSRLVDLSDARTRDLLGGQRAELHAVHPLDWRAGVREPVHRGEEAKALLRSAVRQNGFEARARHERTRSGEEGEVLAEPTTRSLALGLG